MVKVTAISCVAAPMVGRTVPEASPPDGGPKGEVAMRSDFAPVTLVALGGRTVIHEAEAVAVKLNANCAFWGMIATYWFVRVGLRFSEVGAKVKPGMD